MPVHSKALPLIEAVNPKVRHRRHYRLCRHSTLSAAKIIVVVNFPTKPLKPTLLMGSCSMTTLLFLLITTRLVPSTSRRGDHTLSAKYGMTPLMAG